MDGFLKNISASFSQMGSTLTFVAIIIICLLYFLKAPLGELIKGIKVKNYNDVKIATRKIRELWSHDLFITTKEVVKKVNSMRFTTYENFDDSKTRLLRILVSTQIEHFNKRMKDFIKREDVDKMNGQELKYVIVHELRASTRESNEKSKIRFMEMGVSEKDARYLIFEYDHFRDEVQSGFIERIESITTNDNYYCNYDRMSSVFEVLAMGLYLIPKDSVTACNNINGKFRKYNFD